MNQSSLSIDCLSVQKHFALNSLEKSSDTPLQVVGTSSCEASNTYAVYTKEKWYTVNHIQFATAEENTWKDVTPFPDQDVICHDIAQAKFRSKLDMTEAYEQTHIRPEDVCKMRFSTIFSTFRAE